MLDVRRLRILREVARRGTIAAAAEALHLTPPAVSQHLTALEREADAKLLDRDGRSVRLTPAARTLVTHTEAILAQLEAAEADLDVAEGRFGGELRCAAFPTATTALLAPALASLRASHPALAVSVRELEPELALAALLAGEIDLALGHEYDRVPRRVDPALHRIGLLAEPMYVALPADHPQSHSRAPADLALLAEEPWVAPPNGLTCLEELRRTCAAAGFEPRLGSHSYTYETTLALVAAGLGVALVPALARHGPDTTIRVRPIQDPSPERRVFVAVRRGAAHRPSITTALDALARVAKPLRERLGRQARSR